LRRTTHRKDFLAARRFRGSAVVRNGALRAGANQPLYGASSPSPALSGYPQGHDRAGRGIDHASFLGAYHLAGLMIPQHASVGGVTSGLSLNEANSRDSDRFEGHPRVEYTFPPMPSERFCWCPWYGGSRGTGVPNTKGWWGGGQEHSGLLANCVGRGVASLNVSRPGGVAARRLRGASCCNE